MTLELLLFDMDGTLVRYQESSFHSSWDALGFAAGKKKEWLEKRDYYYPHPELCEEWFREQVELLKGIPVEQTISQLLPPPYAPGVKEFFQYLNQQAEKPILGLVTSGIDLIADYIKNDLNLDFVLANELHTKNGYFTGTGKHNVPLWKKGEIVKEVIKNHQISPEKTAYFGDNENDIPAWQEVGYSIAVNPKKPELKNHVDFVVEDFERGLEVVKSL